MHRRIDRRPRLQPRLFWIAVLICVACAGLLAPARPAAAAAFAPGNLVVYRVGNGTDALANTGNPVFLDEYTPAGTLVQSLPLPTVAVGANKALFASGTATSEGLLTRSSNGSYLLLTGYSATPGGSVSATTAAANNRVVARVDGAGMIDTSTALTDFADGNNPRSVASTDGT